MILTTKNGNVIKPIGLGTFPFQGEEMAKIVCCAVESGYNIIDTADDYRGETGIGLAISSKQIKREEVFLQTKISNDTAYADEPLAGKYFNPYSPVMKRHTVEEIVREKVSVSLREMKTDYIDSLLIHYPYPNYFEKIWDVMISMQKEGVVRYIGVSNFRPKHIEVLKASGKVPDINEIYVSPIGTKQDEVTYCQTNGIQIMTYSPLMDIHGGRIHEETFKALMKKYSKSLSQIILRWNIDRGCIPLPKSKNPKRIKENIDILDFQLTKEEVDTILALNQDYQILPESKICPGL